MNLADLDEVHYDLEVDGEQVRRQIGRRIWENRGWATVAVAFQERDAEGSWKPAKLAVLRFRRVRDTWKKQAAVTLPGTEAIALADTIRTWLSAGS